jgi:hypothetical protein
MRVLLFAVAIEQHAYMAETYVALQTLTWA